MGLSKKVQSYMEENKKRKIEKGEAGKKKKKE